MKIDNAQTVSATTLAQWLGLSPSAIAANARLGHVVRAPKRGEYYLRKSIQSYTHHIRERASGREDDATTIERTRLLSAQADSAEAKAKKLADQYVEADWASTTFAAMRHRVLRILGEIPAEAGRRLPHLSTHDLAEVASEVDLAVAPLKEPKDG